MCIYYLTVSEGQASGPLPRVSQNNSGGSGPAAVPSEAHVAGGSIHFCAAAGSGQRASAEPAGKLESGKVLNPL